MTRCTMFSIRDDIRWFIVHPKVSRNKFSLRHSVEIKKNTKKTKKGKLYHDDSAKASRHDVKMSFLMYCDAVIVLFHWEKWRTDAGWRCNGEYGISKYAATQVIIKLKAVTLVTVFQPLLCKVLSELSTTLNCVSNVSTEVGDRVRVQFPVRNIILGMTRHPG